MPQLVITYTTFAKKSQAEKVSQILIKSGMIACANILPISSCYPWGGNIETEDEWIALLKSLPSQANVIMKKVEEIHPYAIPCIWQMNVHCNQAYYEWVKDLVISHK